MNDNAAPFWALAAQMKRAHARSEAGRLRVQSLRLVSEVLCLLCEPSPDSEAARLRAQSRRLAKRAGFDTFDT